MTPISEHERHALYAELQGVAEDVGEPSGAHPFGTGLAGFALSHLRRLNPFGRSSHCAGGE